ncbi:MAG: hypothetical protein RPU13_07650 [Candidatus Sedimenticola sp. (ex Thyasira tokunagai)]
MTKWIFTIALMTLLPACSVVAPDLGQQCFDVHKHKLQDPYSTKIESHYIDPDEGDVIVIYRAKNGFGAYRLGSFECLLRDGAVIKYGTLLRELKDKEKL